MTSETFVINSESIGKLDNWLSKHDRMPSAPMVKGKTSIIVPGSSKPRRGKLLPPAILDISMGMKIKISDINPEDYPKAVIQGFPIYIEARGFVTPPHVKRTHICRRAA